MSSYMARKNPLCSRSVEDLLESVASSRTVRPGAVWNWGGDLLDSRREETERCQSGMTLRTGCTVT